MNHLPLLAGELCCRCFLEILRADCRKEKSMQVTPDSGGHKLSPSATLAPAARLLPADPNLDQKSSKTPRRPKFGPKILKNCLKICRLHG